MAHLVPQGDFIGTVHSAFSGSFNIVVEDLLVTVHDAHMSHTPTSIRVRSTSSVPWLDRVSVGQTVAARSGLLRVGSISLDLSEIPIWKPACDWKHSPSGILMLRDLERICHARKDGRVDLSVDLQTAVARLQASLNSSNTDFLELGDAVEALIGLGPGLTPSGDDVLVGVLAGMNAGCSASTHTNRAARTIANRIEDCAHRTNDISRHYLRLATKGHFGEALTELIVATVRGASLAELVRRTDIVLSIGSSSGSDSLVGILIGLSTQWKVHSELNAQPTAPTATQDPERRR